jgi:hypothetical protein
MTKNKQNAIVTFFLTALFGLFSVSANAAAPANDNWGSAQLISGVSGSVTGTTAEATVQTCEPGHVFQEEANTGAKRTVWYKWLVPANASYTFTTTETDGRYTILSAYRFAPGVCGGNVVSMPYRVVENGFQNVQFGGRPGSRVTFRAVANELIYIAVDSYMDNEVAFQLNWAKTKFRYDLQLDFANSATDLTIKRDTPSFRAEWWMGRNFYMPYIGDFAAQNYGWLGDKPFFADFDGDGVSDMAQVRQSSQDPTVWWIANKNGNLIKVVQFGRYGDKPVVGDYDGDGIADIAVTRREADLHVTWHILRSSDGQYVTFQFGYDADRAMVGDYDGDGKTDVVMLRQADAYNDFKFTWYILRSSDGTVMTREFGRGFSDIPQAVDFDNDGKTDICVFRRGYNDPFSGYWFSLDSSSPLPIDQVPTRFIPFGQSGDAPQAGDYDADGKTDLAIFREETGEWWIRKSNSGQVITYKFGQNDDTPLADTGIAARFIY